MKYCISDIHGEYEKFISMLELIDLSDSDTLYIIGDVLDRGAHPIKTLLKIMEMPNAVFIIGNHELMALECLGQLMREITDDSIADMDETFFENYMTWQFNGCTSTVSEFRALSKELQAEVIEYLKDALAYERVSAGGREFLLVHAGLAGFSPEKKLEEYALDELVWTRTDYSRPYFDHIITVTGHTPTLYIDECEDKGHIYSINNHIDIDCGAHSGGHLGCLCLDTIEEFYV